MHKIGILGGAFNPPHKGHVRLARYFADRLSLDKVLVIPSFIPPHKSAADLAGGADRLEMCRLAFSRDKRFEVSPAEIERGGKSFTYDTLLEIKKTVPQAELFLIIGSDMFLSFNSWHRYRDILKICTLCTAPREKNAELHSGSDDGLNAIISNTAPLVISSTQIREKRRNGEDISEFTGKRVAKYISDRGLYLG